MAEPEGRLRTLARPRQFRRRRPAEEPPELFVTLYHVSDSPEITRFEPRAIGDGPPLVWAIDADHLCNYLLPRDCRHVCFRAGPSSTAEDVALLEGAMIVVAIETAWDERVRTGSVA